LVVLPLIPDKFVGPFHAINFYTLWRLAVVMMCLTACGYIAERVLGPRYGLTLAGFAGGFVSSSATVAAMGVRSKNADLPDDLPVAAACASSISTFIQLFVLVLLAAPSLLSTIVWPLGAGVVVMFAYSLVIAQAMQTVLLGGWLWLRTPDVVVRTLKAWRVSLFAGFMGATASAAWFTAFAIEPVTHVRTLGLVEMIFSYAVSRRFFREHLTRRELTAIALLALGVVLITTAA